MARLMMAVLWPAFLVAIVAEGVFFSVFDPHDACWAGSPIETSALAAYTIGFFFFWGFCALSGMLTCYLLGVSPRDRTSSAN